MKTPVEAIKKVLAYLEEEKANYESTGKPEDHIWRDILKIKQWLKQTEKQQ